MSNFRVKVDLTHFYRDARQICWVYIDGSKIWQIDHVKKHIIKLFNIEEPFHLLLNDTAYLPPHEDVRILKEDELIVAVPGTGMKGDVLSSSHNTMSEVANNLRAPETTTCHSQDEVKQNGEFNGIQQSLTNTVTAEDSSQLVMHKDVHKSSIAMDQEQQNAPLALETALDSSQQNLSVEDDVNNATLYYTILDDTGLDNTVNGNTDSKASESNITEECSIVEKSSGSKRKRIRRRKHKKQESIVNTNVSFDESKSKKPKIINSLIISAGKHIRFDNTENEENIANNTSENEVHSKEFCPNTSFPMKDLSTLLALRQSSTPLTFTRKTTNETKTESTLDNVTVNDIPEEIISQSANEIMAKNTEPHCDNNATINDSASREIKSLINSTGTDICESEKEDDYLSKVELHKLPLMQSVANVGDTVVFKMLKIGLDYTPQVSNFIVVEVLSYHPETKVYHFKVIQGKDEIQVPMGKFALPDEEVESALHDTVFLNHAQMMEPRLLKTFNSSTE